MSVEAVIAVSGAIISLLLGVVAYFLKSFHAQTEALTATVQQLQISTAGFTVSASALAEQLHAVATEVKEMRSVHERLARLEARLDERPPR